MFGTVLIANRGEIALRVARTCRELGIRTVVVYSSADSDGAVLRVADQAIRIGPPPIKQSYLNAAAVMEAALLSGAEAIHPGYGFLSEDPDFADICERNGVIFIGPPSDVLARLGDKAEARVLMAECGLPILPGSPETVDNSDDAQEVADAIGYPVIVKAAAGGGGRGMAVVHDGRDLRRIFQQTRATAHTVFGDSRVYIEKYVEAARHVEVQILTDKHGSSIYLGERDCSVQRRHQKLVEETPASRLPLELTARMGEAAASAALMVGYVGAGTFEFLVDNQGQFYFMEINCRIQVEHPVTEMVTGIDLVREQLRVAAGERLGITQADVAPRGVAIECRVNAEDPDRNFAPAVGLLSEFQPPGGPFVRVDTHGSTGARITPEYDSLLAKVIAWAPDRDQAIARMDRALDEFRIDGEGVCTTIGFLRRVLADQRFSAGQHTTGLVDQIFAEGRR